MTYLNLLQPRILVFVSKGVILSKTIFKPYKIVLSLSIKIKIMKHSTKTLTMLLFLILLSEKLVQPTCPPILLTDVLPLPELTLKGVVVPTNANIELDLSNPALTEGTPPVCCCPMRLILSCSHPSFFVFFL